MTVAALISAFNNDGHKVETNNPPSPQARLQWPHFFYCEESLPTVIEKESPLSKTDFHETIQLIESRVDHIQEAVPSACGQKEFRQHIEGELMNIRSSIDELRGFDTVTLTWPIAWPPPAGRSNSENYRVAQYAMRLQLLLKDCGDNDSNKVGIYICHSNGHGYDWLPLQLGGSEVTLVGTDAKDTVTRQYSVDPRIKDAGRGYGWRYFVCANDIDKYLVAGKVTVKATVRVPRSRSLTLQDSKLVKPASSRLLREIHRRLYSE